MARSGDRGTRSGKQSRTSFQNPSYLVVLPSGDHNGNAQSVKDAFANVMRGMSTRIVPEHSGLVQAMNGMSICLANGTVITVNTSALQGAIGAIAFNSVAAAGNAAPKVTEAFEDKGVAVIVRQVTPTAP